MKKYFLSSLLVVVAFVSAGYAQKAQPAKASSEEAAIRRTISYLTADKLEGRRTGEPGATEAGNYLAKQFAAIGLRPAFTDKGKRTYLQPFPYKEVTGYNVVGILPGRDAKLKKEAIVIGAHYDHLGRGGEGSLAANSTEIHHGADDNASGTAAMLELARLFAKERSNERTFIFIAFSGEEEGLFGSKYYVNNPVVPVEDTIAMINLDMVGRLHDGKLNIGGIGTAAEWKALVENLNKGTAKNAAHDANSLPFTLQLTEDGFGPSDHSSFYTKKIPVLFFFTGTHLDYHKPTDTAEKINYAGELSIMNYIRTIAKAIDRSPKRPTYEVAKSSGTSGGRSGFKVTLGTIPSYTDATDGLVIDGVRDDSPAAHAGLKGNDKIVRLAGIEVKTIQDYMKALNEMEPGKEYEIIVLRGAERLTFKITPEKR